MAIDDRLAATLNEATRLREEARSMRGDVRGGGNGGSFAGTGDPLKPRVDFLHTAFLWLAGALVTAVIGIIAIAVTMTNATNGRLDRSNEELSALSRDIGQVSVKVDDANRRLDRIDQKLDQLGTKLDKR